MAGADRPLNRAERRDLKFNKGCQNHGCRNRKSQHKMKTNMGMDEKTKKRRKGTQFKANGNGFGSKFKKLFGGKK